MTSRIFTKEVSMGKIFCIIGKSATGKDSIYKRLLQNEELHLQKIVPYTTRPIREGEKDGREYHFCTEEDVQRLDTEGRIIELRAYHTIYGVWKYFTVNDDKICLDKNNYLFIGTLEAYVKIRDYFGKEQVVPIYVEVEDGERLIRAIDREKTQNVPKYEEMCRRFLADAVDFSEENLQKAEIHERFCNIELEDTICMIEEYIRKENSLWI